MSLLRIRIWSKLEEKHVQALQKQSHLDIKPTRVQSDVTLPIEEDIYYVPKKTNQVVIIDSFIVSDGD